MGIIHPIRKWSLEKNAWTETNPKNVGRSFCLGEYENIINDESSAKFNYIIIAEGSRVEDHSRDFISIKDKEVGIDKVISFFKNKKYNYKIISFLMDADAPIIEDAKLFAKIIDDFSIDKDCESINLIGISKCGTMSFNIPKYFKKSLSYEKTNLYTIATPFEGTKIASPKLLYPEIETWIRGIMGKNKLSDLVSKKLINLHKSINSNSHMDYDIAVLDGVNDENLSRYDRSFISNMFCEDNIKAQAKLNKYINFETGIDDNTLKEAIQTFNITGIGLCMVNSIFLDKKSDGLVLVKSQEAVANHIPDLYTKKLKSSHHVVMTIDRIVKEILYVVDDVIDEQIKEKGFENENRIIS